MVRKDAGHGGGKPLPSQIKERAEIFAFMAKALNIKWIDWNTIEYENV